MKLVKKDEGAFGDVIYSLEGAGASKLESGLKGVAKMARALEKEGYTLSESIRCDGEYANEKEFGDVGQMWFKTVGDFEKAVPEIAEANDYNVEMMFKKGGKTVGVAPFLGKKLIVDIFGEESIVKATAKIVAGAAG